MPQTATAQFDLDGFIADCCAAIRESESQKAVQGVMARAVSEPSAVIKAFGAPIRGEVQKIYHGKNLTILNVVWPAHISLMPHDHQMWSVVGIYSGREDNIFWQRLPGDENGRIEATGAKNLGVGDAISMDANAIHSVLNPLQRLTCAIHIYGGDFFGETARSEWDPETLVRSSYDARKMLRTFEEANAWRVMS